MDGWITILLPTKVQLIFRGLAVNVVTCGHVHDVVINKMQFGCSTLELLLTRKSVCRYVIIPQMS